MGEWLCLPLSQPGDLSKGYPASHPMTVGISSSLCDPELDNRKKMDGWMDAKRSEETGHQAEIDSHDPNFPKWTGLQQYTWCYLRNGLPSVKVWMAVWRREHTDTYTNMCTHNATLLPFKATYSLLIISNGGRQRWQNKLKVQQGNLKNVETISDVGMLGLWPLCKKTESPIRRTECLWHKNYILVKIHGCTSTHSPPHTVCGFTQDSHAHLSSQ